MGKKLEIEGRTFGHLKAIRNTGEKQRLKGRFNQPPLFYACLLFRQPWPPQRPILIRSKRHRLCNHPALSIHDVPLTVYGLLACYHSTISAQIVPVVFILVPHVMYHHACAVKPVPLALMPVPIVANQLTVAKVISPAAIFLLPA